MLIGAERRTAATHTGRAPIPRTLARGLGADFETYCLVSAELGRWSGATALTFNMHWGTMLWTSQMADDLEMSAADRDSHEQKILEKLAKRYLGSIVKDPELRAKLTPSYTIGCKRILISNDDYQAAVRPSRRP